jgi:hypothetical protein
VGKAERQKSTLKTAGVKQIIAGRTLNAVSDGAFAATRITALRVLSGFLLFSYTPCHRISSPCRS